MSNLTGRRFDYTIPEGLPEKVSVLLLDSAGNPRELAGSAWVLGVFGDDYADSGLVVESGAEKGELLLNLPALAGGTYRWELSAVADSGDVSCVMYGELTAVDFKSAKALLAEALKVSTRRIELVTGEGFLTVLQARWRATTAAEVFAGRAEAAATLALGMEEILKEGVEASVRALAEAQEALGKLEGLDAMLEAFRHELYTQLHISEGGTWVIAGRDTLYPARGEQGEPGRDGADGRDGRACYLVRVDSVDDIPNNEAAWSSGDYYLVEEAGGSRVTYRWARELDGTFSLVQISVPVDFATASIWGMVKLSTDVPVTTGGLVGQNAAGQMMVPPATESSFGSLRLGTKVVQKEAIPYLLAPGVDTNKRLCSNLLRRGCLRYHNAAYWAGKAVTGIPDLDSTQAYLGVLTSEQFTQDAEEGLKLNAATEGMLGGVYKCLHPDDANEDSVMPSAAVNQYFARKDDVFPKSETYHKSSVYTQAEVDLAISQAKQELKEWVEAKEAGDGLVPAGTLLFAALAEMDGYLLCDGREVSREEYPRLFAKIGTRFGEVEGNDTFKLPDMRGRVMWGADGDFAEYKQGGIPDIYGEFTTERKGSNATPPSGAFQVEADNQPSAGGNGLACERVSFRASRVSSVYGRSETVQPPALALNAFIKT